MSTRPVIVDLALGMGNSAQPDPIGWEHVEAFRVAAEVGAHVVATPC
jgi:hypothetical protein